MRPALLALLLAAAGCTPTPGDACSGEHAFHCGESDTVVLCTSGKYQRVGACDPGQSCHWNPFANSSDSVSCGQQSGLIPYPVAVADAPCHSEGSAVCDAAADAAVLDCKAGVWVAKPCKAGQVCKRISIATLGCVDKAGP